MTDIMASWWQCPICNQQFSDNGKTNKAVILEQEAHLKGCKSKKQKSDLLMAKS